MAVGVLAFILIQTVIAAWKIGVTTAAKDRLVTRHKITFVMNLPKRYVEEIRQTPGVKQASWATWFGGKDPKHKGEFFMAIGVEPESYLDVYDELGITPAERTAWCGDRQGAILGDVLAKKFGIHVGDEVTLESDIYKGEWKFRVQGIYRALRKSAARDMFLFDWDYLNETLPAAQKDQVGWITARVDGQANPAEVSQRLDARFEEQEVQTISQDEGSFQQSFLGMMSTILAAMNIVSIVILGIMMLILGNTVAMGVRERVREHGILRALGFVPPQIGALIVGEATTLGLLGGALGLLLAVGACAAIGPFLEENMSMFFPVFRLGAETAALGVGAAAALGSLAGAVPAWQAARLRVTEALRQVA